MLPTNSTINRSEVRLGIAAKETHCKQKNRHLDVQVYVQIQVTRHCLQRRTTCRSQTRLRITMILTTRSKLITTDQNQDTIYRNDHDDNSPSTPEKKMLANSKEKHHHPSFTTKKNIGKLKLSKPRMGGTRSNLVFIISFYYDVLYL